MIMLKRSKRCAAVLGWLCGLIKYGMCTCAREYYGYRFAGVFRRTRVPLWSLQLCGSCSAMPMTKRRIANRPKASRGNELS